MEALSYDQIVAANIRAARARAGLDQAVIVERMRALGFTTWHRQTQGKVERGERRLLGADEIMALAWCLGTTVFELLKPAGTDGLVRFPSGDLIAAHSVAMSVGSYNDQAVTWRDGDPSFALTDLDQTINIVRHPGSRRRPRRDDARARTGT
jgi:transcriptional regulator with XRE-family HTH domain